MGSTKIDWADRVWNPVRGCNINCTALDGTSYCYAKRNNGRGMHAAILKKTAEYMTVEELDVLKDKLSKFEPVEIPHKWEERFPMNAAVFVNSMSDVSCWEEVWSNKLHELTFYCFPCTNFIILTKEYKFNIDDWNPLHGNTYLGYTVTTNTDIERLFEAKPKHYAPLFTPQQFINIEPLLEPLTAQSIEMLSKAPAVIIGAETGNRKGNTDLKNVSEWIRDIVIGLHDDNDYRGKLFIKKPVLEVFIEDMLFRGAKREDVLKIFRQLLWTTRKSLV